MNKYELQVVKELSELEGEIIAELKTAFAESLNDVKYTIKQLQFAIDELNEDITANESIVRSKIYQLKYQQLLREEIELNLNLLQEKNIKNIADYLKKMYNNNYLGMIYSLQKEYNIPVHNPVNPLLMAMSVLRKTEDYIFSQRLYSDIGELKKVVKAEISRGIASGKSYRDIAKNIAKKYDTEYYNAVRIARTEGARVSSEAQLQSINDAVNEGADLLKRWDATLDSKTRDTHRELDGQIAEYNQDFVYSGGTVSAPTKFEGATGASENINCRCRLSVIPRWAVDKTATRKDNISGEIIPYKTYDEWKKTYIKSF